MSTDYRTLCAELVEAWDATADFDFNDFGHAAADIVTRARTALAQPEPVAPTDEELWSVGNDDFRANCYPTDAIYFARAVLDRWGQP